MPDTTPGQVCYVAYVRVRYGLPEADAALTYVRSIPEERAAWEAAAQAAITAWIASPDWPTPTPLGEERHEASA